MVSQMHFFFPQRKLLLFLHISRIIRFTILSSFLPDFLPNSFFMVVSNIKKIARAECHNIIKYHDLIFYILFFGTQYEENKRIEI